MKFEIKLEDLIKVDENTSLILKKKKLKESKKLESEGCILRPNIHPNPHLWMLKSYKNHRR